MLHEIFLSTEIKTSKATPRTNFIYMKVPA
jgi:hypothetical protein